MVWEVGQLQFKFLISLLILAGLASFPGCTAPANTDQRPPDGHDSNGNEYTLVISVGPSADDDREFVISANQINTVLDLLQHAQSAGLIHLELRGSGELAFVLSINNLANDPANDKFWVYYVNAELAKAGCGVYSIQPSDKVRWSYEKSPFE